MTIALIKQVVIVALYVLGGIPIDTHKDLHQPACPWRLHAIRPVRDRIGPGFGNVQQPQEMRLRTYTYRFEGRVLYHGIPQSNAKVFLRVTTSRALEMRQAITRDDGSYDIALKFEGSRHEPVDWEMRAYTADLKIADLVGRRIAMREDDTVTVHRTFDLVTPEA